jgi:anti-sigma regulatory factor (Ser/Thr protein kinase)
VSLPFAGDSPRSGIAVSQSLSLKLGDASRVGEARRLAMTLGTRAGLDASEVENLRIAVTEIASNTVNHGGGGELLLRLLEQDGRTGVEALFLDAGPGMANVAECLRDGYSTAGTMGTGLGAARRLVHEFDLHSMPDSGTAVVLREWKDGPAAGGRMMVAGVCLPVSGESESGDAWATLSSGPRTLVLVADGLGHGSSAAAAANLAVSLFRANATRSAAEILDLLHLGLRPTRGAAVAIAEIDITRSTLSFAGIGNIAGRLLTSSGMRSMISHNGIVGHQARPAQAFTYPWTSDTTLVMHSDGLKNQWKHEAYAGILRRDPALLAGLLYRDFARDRDDSSVIVCRQGAAA